MKQFITSIEREGQPYIDEPVRVFPKPRTEIEQSVSAAFGNSGPRPITVGHDRIRLRWMKPDGKGGVVPR